MLLLTAVLIAACGGSGGDNAGDGEGQVTEISFVHWRGEDMDVFNEIIDKFEAENNNIRVSMNAYPSREYEATLQTRLRGGGAGDVFAMFPGSQFAAITGAGFPVDLSGEDFVDRFQPHLIEAGQLDGAQYGLPFQLVFNIPVYNKAMFEEVGIEPAKDWDGFLEMLEALKQHGVEMPIIFPAADNGPGQFMNPMMMNNALEEDIWEQVQAGERQVTEEWWVKTLSQIDELNQRGYFGADPLGTTQDVSSSLLAQERGAMIAMGSYMMAQVVDQNPALEGQLGLLAPITVSEDEAVYEGIHTTTFMLAVNSQSDKQEEAKKFIEFLTRPEIASIYANGTGQHLTVEGVEYESAELRNNAHWMEKNTRFQPRFTITNQRVNDAVLASIEEVLGGTTPEQAAADAQRIIDQAIN